MSAEAAIHRAIDLLSRASADWRNADSRGGAALHWPVAVTLARSELREAIAALDGPATFQNPYTDDQQKQQKGLLRATPTTDYEPLDTNDARAGLAWYNSATVAERRHRHQVARSAVPADAWEAYKAEAAQP